LLVVNDIVVFSILVLFSGVGQWLLFLRGRHNFSNIKRCRSLSFILAG
jgi:hypothetical protein